MVRLLGFVIELSLCLCPCASTRNCFPHPSFFARARSKGIVAFACASAPPTVLESYLGNMQTQPRLQGSEGCAFCIGSNSVRCDNEESTRKH